MDFKQIEYFLDVAKTKNITKSSKNLYVSQSTLSKSIKRLEEELNVKLFARRNDGVELTSEGVKLKKYFEASSSNIINVKDLFSDDNDQMQTLKISMIPDLYPLFHEQIKKYEQLYPHIKLEFREGTFLQFEKDLLLGNTDVCICGIIDEEMGPNIICNKAIDDKVKAFVKKEDRFLEDRVYSICEFKDLSLYSVKSSPVIDKEVKKRLKNSDCLNENIIDVYGWRFSMNMIYMNGGIVYLASIFEKAYSNENIISLDTDLDLYIGLYTCYCDNNNKTQDKINFCEIIKDALIH